MEQRQRRRSSLPRICGGLLRLLPLCRRLQHVALLLHHLHLLHHHLVGALLLLVSIIIYRLIQQRTYLGTARLQSPIDRFFAQEHLASQAAESKELQPDVLQMLDRISLWMGSRRSQNAAERLPVLVGLLVGGGMALLMGILLFRPLAETLQMIVDGGAPGR